MDWDRRIKHDRGCELAGIEEQIVDLYLVAPTSILSIVEIGILLSLKARKASLLVFKDSSWRLESRAVWIKLGDANTEFFQNFASARRNGNSIWG